MGGMRVRLTNLLDLKKAAILLAIPVRVNATCGDYETIAIVAFFQVSNEIQIKIELQFGAYL